MAIRKQYLKTKPYCKVTFRLDKQSAGNARQVAVAGDFNAWEGTQTPMKPLKSGDFSVTVDLLKGREYQYRFVIDGRHWVTDRTADKQVYCDFAQGENAVVVV